MGSGSNILRTNSRFLLKKKPKLRNKISTTEIRILVFIGFRSQFSIVFGEKGISATIFGKEHP
ncbi:hypothetical protein LEP1GSC171_0981 [Leptospira santarosai str. HAI1380]|uniref:Uncharacterized protein n=2 Tax=Leptospira santarosai TaxID=28183 RepID=A0A0E2BJX6_9LEPT|nr:hypothetical protein LEP1GSC179_1114 [Leptospira santarosai str. MOR084]EKR92632.1 hypothetical protein LEP1GSC163_2025 [Leptospira santarosai str. CBC379]EKS09666.1 hypothetical protein LEP1GSC071_1298 [Leptospira santarosai str. JET]EMF89474.1 hypothetical protein LEP1GSC005_0801 [Leptospira santarosai str. ST188]EMM78955.1 hypothetical protein LEP1GSC040_2265 [Leptospira santarosai str. 2000030832]EMM85348.1 hypothetical protein LEP1GSC039_0680 [Leptospira santarosai str. 2000027870]EMN